MLSQVQKTFFMAILIPLFVVVACLQIHIDPQRHKYEPGYDNTGAAVKGLPIEFAIGAFAGFREAIAGLLWARADEFFHTGNYEAVVPMVRIITWLDPHFVTVYETGAWHMDYNFTDWHEVSDRRYVPISIALMNEGIKNNPNAPELVSDLALTHYFRKIQDYEKAKDTFEIAQKKVEEIFANSAKHPNDPNLLELKKNAAASVVTVGHGLAHSYEALGMIPEALKEWEYCIFAHQRNINQGLGIDTGESLNLQTSRRQLYEMTMRVKWRKDIAKHPVDMKFRPVLTRVAPKVFTLSGTLNTIGSKNFILETGKTGWGPVPGTRVTIRINDAGYKTPTISSFTLSSINLDPAVTIFQDTTSVRDGKLIDRKIDMSQDPKMYGLASEKYDVNIWFNPSSPSDDPIEVQDRIGWLGEGMTDSKYLDVSGIVPGDITPVPGLRILKKTFTLTREDILGKGVKVFD